MLNAKITGIASYVPDYVLDNDGYMHRLMRILPPCKISLYSSFLTHHIPAAVVTALRAYGVINMPCTTVGALGNGGSNSHVVCAALGCASL